MLLCRQCCVGICDGSNNSSRMSADLWFRDRIFLHCPSGRYRRGIIEFVVIIKQFLGPCALPTWLGLVKPSFIIKQIVSIHWNINIPEIKHLHQGQSVFQASKAMSLTLIWIQSRYYKDWNWMQTLHCIHTHYLLHSILLCQLVWQKLFLMKRLYWEDFFTQNC